MSSVNHLEQTPAVSHSVGERIARAACRLRDAVRRNPDYAGSVASSFVLLGLNIVIQIVLVPLYLHTIGAYQFGILMMLLSFIAYASIGVGWLSGGMLRIMGEHAAVDDREEFAKTYALAKVIYLGYAVLIAGGMILVGLAFSNLLLGDSPPEYRHATRMAVVVGAVYFVILYDFNVEKLALVAMQRQAIANVFQILSQVIFLACVVPWLLSGGNLEGILASLMAGILPARVASYLYWRKLGVNVRIRWLAPDSWAAVRRLIGPMGLGYLLYGAFMLTLQADVMLVGYLSGPLVAAQFVLLWKAAEVLIQLIWKFPESMAPILIQMDARGEQDAISRLYRRSLRMLELLSLTAGVAYGLLGHWIVSLWVGPERAPSDPLGYWLAGACIFWLGSARLPAVFASSTLALTPLNWVAGCEILLKVILLVLLFPRFGYMAPLAALCIAHLMGVAWAYRRLRRQAKVGAAAA